MICCQWWHRILSAGVLLAASALAALAADDSAGKGDERGDLFKQLDRNGDGEIAADELGPEQQRMFQRLLRTGDKNDDGKLSRDEFMAGTKETPPASPPGGDRPGGRGPGGGPGPEQAEMIFKQLDANGDGKLVISEVPEERRERFEMLIERFDADGDKALTLVEFTKGFTGGRGPEGASPGRPPMPPGAPPAPNDPVFRALDTNGDGKLSKDEIEDAPKALEKLDRDHNGEITRYELGGPRQYAMGSQGNGPPQGDGAMAYFNRLDTNGDGKLSKDEAPERMKENFDRLDTNNDGFIDGPEMQRMLGAMRGRGDGQGRPEGQGPSPQQMLERMDKNGDGKLSKDEVGERMREHFDELDTNNDGFIDSSELGRMLGGMRRRGDSQGRPEGQGRPGEGRPEGRRGEGRGRPEGRPDPKQMIERLDKNGDGKLSKDEMPERLQEQFDRIDANGDGKVDAEELERAMSQMMRNRQGRPEGDKR